jgi:hypothetical protein
VNRVLLVGTLAFGMAVSVGVALPACGSGSNVDASGDAVTADGGEDSDPPPTFVQSEEVGTAPPADCKGLQCQIPVCKKGTKTTLTGKVIAPTRPEFGSPDPIYNAVVYVPNAELSPFPAGASCDKCGALASGSPMAATLTGADGSFVLEGVPAGESIPLVVQVGRWRRRVVVPSVASCTDTKIPVELTRLPRNKSEGDIPLMAIATSQFDPTECILRKIGIDDAEFTVPTGTGRVHLYQGMGATLPDKPPSASTLWANQESLQRYDLIALPCQQKGGPDAPGKERLAQYADNGGRLFVTDRSRDVIQNGPTGWPQTANWGEGVLDNPAFADTTFPKGKALADWMYGVGATQTRGEFDLFDTYPILLSVNPPAQRWVYSKGTTQTYSFNTPVTAAPENTCGRVVFSSFHIASPVDPKATFPLECSPEPLTPQEKVLEFLLFDLAACIQKDDTAPAPPPVVR